MRFACFALGRARGVVDGQDRATDARKAKGLEAFEPAIRLLWQLFPDIGHSKILTQFHDASRFQLRAVDESVIT